MGIEIFKNDQDKICIDYSDADDTLRNFIDPFDRHIKNVSNPDCTTVCAKEAIDKLRQYTHDEPPHDSGLYTNQIKQLKELLEKNFSVDDYPELWL